MSLVAALLVCALVARACAEQDYTRGAEDTSACDGFNRQEAIDCVMRYVHDGETKDANGHPCIVGAQIDHERSRCLTKLERAGASFMGFLGFDPMESIDEMMERCDANRDGCISEMDFWAAERTCLNNCHKLRQFNDYVCKRKHSGKC